MISKIVRGYLWTEQAIAGFVRVRDQTGCMDIGWHVLYYAICLIKAPLASHTIPSLASPLMLRSLLVCFLTLILEPLLELLPSPPW
jgi:hypothetical protein